MTTNEPDALYAQLVNSEPDDTRNTKEGEDHSPDGRQARNRSQEQREDSKHSKKHSMNESMAHHSRGSRVAEPLDGDEVRPYQSDSPNMSMNKK